MARIRVIPTLLMARSRGGLVKGVRFRKHTYVGDPINAVKVFNDKEVDEICVLDIEAGRNGGPDLAWIEEICGEAFMPLAYGGGVTTADQARRILHGGAEKVVLNTAAVRSPRLVSEIAKVAGAQSVVVSIDVKTGFFGGRRVVIDSGAESTGLDPVDHARRMADAGAGEILLTSIDREGTSSGYDLELVRDVSAAVQVPVIANGGAASTDHFRSAVRSGASAVAAGSMFVFKGPHRAVLISYPSGTEMERLNA